MPLEIALSPMPAVPDAAGNDVPAVLSTERRLLCVVVRQLTAELLVVAGDRARPDRTQPDRDRRRATTHVRQIAMYVCHVALSMPYGEIGLAFGVDRTTVSHACHVVEDRRDDAGFDAFVSSVERLAEAVCLLSGRAA